MSFYEAGSANGVTVSEACALMVRTENGKTIVTVSDPTHLLKNLTVTLTLDGVTAVESADSAVNATVNGNTVTLDLSIEGNVGNTFTVVLK